MLGTAASLAGIQNMLNASMTNWAANSQTRLSTTGIEANSAKRRQSVTTIVLRRSNRSAKAPASGPSTIAGSSRNSSTAPSAKFLPAKLSTSEVAVAVIASRPSQSPKLDRAIDSHSRRKSRTRRTARIFDGSPTAPAVDGSFPSAGSTASATGPGTGAASGGTGGSPEARPPVPGATTASSGRRPAPSSGGCAGKGGSDGIAGSRGEAGGPEAALGGVHGTGRYRPLPAVASGEEPVSPAVPQALRDYGSPVP